MLAVATEIGGDGADGALGQFGNVAVGLVEAGAGADAADDFGDESGVCVVFAGCAGA